VLEDINVLFKDELKVLSFFTMVINVIKARALVHSYEIGTRDYNFDWQEYYYHLFTANVEATS